MKIIKILLIAIVLVSALFQVVAGAWMLIDIEGAGSLLLGITTINTQLLNSFELRVVTKIAGKSFVMLAVYSFLTCYFILKEGKSGLILGLAGGFMIMGIAITTFIDTKSMLVWATDFTRGMAILILTGVFYRLKVLQNTGK